MPTKKNRNSKNTQRILNSTSYPSNKTSIVSEYKRTLSSFYRRIKTSFLSTPLSESQINTLQESWMLEAAALDVDSLIIKLNKYSHKTMSTLGIATPVDLPINVRSSIIETLGYSTNHYMNNIINYLHGEGDLSNPDPDYITGNLVRKTISTLNTTRAKHAGFTQFIWVHSSASLRPRILHQQADGKVFDLNDPPRIGDSGEPVMPGESRGCRCRARFIEEIDD